MSRKIQIQYTLSPQLQAKQWLSEDIKLAKALKTSQKVLKGEMSDSVWAKYENLSWQNVEGVWTLRTESVPVKTFMRGIVELSINALHRVNVAFKMEETQRVWQAAKIFEDPLELLEVLRKQTVGDFADPVSQEAIALELGNILSLLYAEWDLPSLEDKFSTYALKIARLVQEYHAQWHNLEWVVRDQSGEALPSGGYAWHGQSPLHHEALRALYYITQSFSLLEKKNNTLWIDPATAMGGVLDLSFLNTRLHTMQGIGFSAGGKRNNKQVHPGDADLANTWFKELKSFVEQPDQDPLDEDTLRLIWNTAVVFDYVPRLNADSQLEWNSTSVRVFLADPEFRSAELKEIPPASLSHNTYLDEAVTFWEEGGFAELGSGGRKVARVATRVFRDYFAFLEAKAQGLSFPVIPVYNVDDVAQARRRFPTGDVSKKLEPLLQVLEDRGPCKYSALAPADAALEAVALRFPNFKEIIAQVQKQLRLARLQEYPVIRLHPMLIVGDPGWGKTRFLKALSDALKLPFNEIPMSSVTAGFVLSGADLMWHSAKQGRIADLFMHGVCINPMVVLDELDKVNGEKQDPYGPLYQLLESHTAARFTDEALNVPLDTQYISWCATANNIDNIPEPIISRFDIFEIPALLPSETPLVAQSIFDDLLKANLWRDAFNPVLTPAFCKKLHGLNARAMYFALRGACANAAARETGPRVLLGSDLEKKGRKKQSMGFVSN